MALLRDGLLTINEVAIELGVSYPTAYNIVRVREEIPSVEVGHRRFVRIEDLSAYVGAA